MKNTYTRDQKGSEKLKAKERWPIGRILARGWADAIIIGNGRRSEYLQEGESWKIGMIGEWRWKSERQTEPGRREMKELQLLKKVPDILFE